VARWPLANFGCKQLGHNRKNCKHDECLTSTMTIFLSKKSRGHWPQHATLQCQRHARTHAHKRRCSKEDGRLLILCTCDSLRPHVEPAYMRETTRSRGSYGSVERQLTTTTTIKRRGEPAASPTLRTRIAPLRVSKTRPTQNKSHPRDQDEATAGGCYADRWRALGAGSTRVPRWDG